MSRPLNKDEVEFFNSPGIHDKDTICGERRILKSWSEVRGGGGGKSHLPSDEEIEKKKGICLGVQRDGPDLHVTAPIVELLEQHLL